MWGVLVHEELNKCREKLPRVGKFDWDNINKEHMNTDTWTSDFTRIVHGYYTFGHTTYSEVIRDKSIWKKKYEEEALLRFIIPLDNAYEELFGYKFSDKITWKNMRENAWMVGRMYVYMTRPLFYNNWYDSDWPDE